MSGVDMLQRGAAIQVVLSETGNLRESVQGLITHTRIALIPCTFGYMGTGHIIVRKVQIPVARSHRATCTDEPVGATEYVQTV